MFCPCYYSRSRNNYLHKIAMYWACLECGGMLVFVGGVCSWQVNSMQFWGILECMWILVSSGILEGILHRYQGMTLKRSWRQWKTDQVQLAWGRKGEADWTQLRRWYRNHRRLSLPVWWLWTVSGRKMLLMGKVLARMQAGESRFIYPGPIEARYGGSCL